VTNEASTRRLPSNWADDSLSEFINDAFGNTLATFAQKKPQYSILSTIDSCFDKITTNLSITTEVLEPLFLIRSHSAYRAGCQLAMSGQSTESFCVLRSCLEFGLYGLHIANDGNLGEIWLKRHETEESLKRVRGKFSNRAVIESLRTLDETLHETVKVLYERTIDYGGHPNERSITSNLTMKVDDEDLKIRQYSLAGDSLVLEHGLKSAAQIGLSALYMFRHIYREKFDILGVTPTLDKLRDIL
jgi:hypothetical protein